MSLSEAQQKMIDAATDNGVDHTEDGPAFESNIPEAGWRVCRLVEYIELGVQPQKAYKGAAKDPCMEVRIGFELFGKKNDNGRDGDIIEVKDKDGKPTGEKTGTMYYQYHTVKLSEKAKFKKLFLKMQYGRQDKTAMFQMLGEPFKIGIIHNQAEATAENKNPRTYANMNDKDGVYLIGAAVGIAPQDDMGNATGPAPAIPTPKERHPIRVFLMDYPTIESWESLFVEGSYTKKDAAGKETEHSKNTVQNKILSATNFKGSALEALLAGLDKLPMGDMADSGIDDLPGTDDALDGLDGMDDMGGEAKQEAEPEKPSPTDAEKEAAQTTSPETTQQTQDASTSKTAGQTASPSEGAKPSTEDDPFAGLDDLEM